jgi:hypothetical protein
MPGRLPGRPPGRPQQPQPQPPPGPPPAPAPQPHPQPPAPHGTRPAAGPIRHAGPGTAPAAPPPLSSPETAENGGGGSYDLGYCTGTLVSELVNGADPYQAIVEFLACVYQSTNGAIQPAQVGMDAHRRSAQTPHGTGG